MTGVCSARVQRQYFFYSLFVPFAMAYFLKYHAVFEPHGVSKFRVHIMRSLHTNDVIDAEFHKLRFLRENWTLIHSSLLQMM